MPTCKQVLELLADQRLNDDGDLRPEITEHLAGCAECRRAALELESLWSQLGDVPAPTPAPDAADRFHRMAHSVLRRHVMIGKPVLTAVIAAALLAGVGFTSLFNQLSSRLKLTPSTSSGDSMAVADTTGPRFMILIRDADNHPPGHPAEQVEEYRRWARSLANQGRLLGAEKLSDGDGVLLTGEGASIAVRPQPRSDSMGVIGGYFVFRAHDRREAEAIARECPGLKHGSTIELRQIDPT